VNIPQNVGPNENYINLEVVGLSLARWSQQSMPTLQVIKIVVQKAGKSI
jgi:hypothetical protein